MQKIQTNLLSADATATNAFLVGGLEPPAQRASYDQAMTTPARLIAEAAQAQPADAEALAALNQELVSYAAAIEQARANNRQGLPVGAQYLRNASAQLRADGAADPGQPGRRPTPTGPTTRWTSAIGYVAVAVAAARPGRPSWSSRSGWPAGSGAGSTSACCSRRRPLLVA